MQVPDCYELLFMVSGACFYYILQLFIGSEETLSILQRYMIFFIGVIIQATGISLVVKSLLGTSPISSVPYVWSMILPYSFGTMTFAVNMLFLAGQVLLLRRRFQLLQLLQIPITFVFAVCIDMTMLLFVALLPEWYVSKLAVLILGAACVALGVALQVIANVIMLAGEAFVYAVTKSIRIDFGVAKTVFDICLVVLAAMSSWVHFGSIYGIREGTLISALITGMMARTFIRHLAVVDKTGSLIFHPSWHCH